MHLLNVETIRLKKTLARQKPRYAILSHRWTKEEVAFATIKSNHFQLRTTSNKFQGAVEQARRESFKYLWVDSCCIDTRSSSELSEAINSMYQWYQDAEVCYVYLQDVDTDNWQESLGQSKWFTRGWTLQELIAPRKVVFYDYQWRFLGDKRMLADKIHGITGIPSDVLHTGDLTPYSVAQKMAWAATRITTRFEDGAYCLMGLFRVNMPLLYGEGNKAFVRLQEEIIKQNDDHSIFAWSMGKRRVSGLLAPAPHCFARSQEMVPHLFPGPREPFSMTNRGLSIKLKITPWSADTYVAYLDCAEQENESLIEHKRSTRVGIFLRRLHEDDQYVRIRIGRTGLWFDTKRTQYWEDRPVRDKQLFVHQGGNRSWDKDCLKDRVYGFRISDNCLPPGSCIQGPCISANGRLATLPPGGWGCIAIVSISGHHKGLRKIALGFDFDFNPICLLEDSFSTRVDDSDSKLQNWYDWSHMLADDTDWDEIIEGSRVIRRPVGVHNGLWRLRGHRQRGLDVLLSESFTDKGSLVTFKRDTEETRLAWKLNIDSLIGPFRNHQHEALSGPFGNREDFQRVYGLSEDSEGLEDGDEILRGFYPSIGPEILPLDV